jgi:poly(3-hydroxybutyrate) depolymerase
MTRVLFAAVLAGALAGVAAAAVLPRVNLHATRIVVFHYVAHDGATRAAFLLLPRWYTVRRDSPLPLVISPHGRGINARANASVWGDLPGRDGFAVINPEGPATRSAALRRSALGSGSGLLYREIERLHPKAPVAQVVGRWRHGQEMRWYSGLPEALSSLGLH